MLKANLFLLYYCLLFFFSPAIARAEENIAIDVYCTSNLDSTGVCVDEKTQISFTCLIIPGQIIECKDKNSIDYECVMTTQITPTQAQFSCSKLVSTSALEIPNDDPEIESNALPNDFENAF